MVSKNLLKRGYLLTVSSLLAFGLIAGCGEDDDSDAAKGDDALTGTWVGACTEEEDTGLRAAGSSSHLLSVNYKGGTETSTYTEFSDAACKTKTSTMVAVGTYKLGDAFGEGNKFDTTISTLSLIVDDDATVTYWNSAELCGAGFFTKGTTKEIKATDCNGIYKETFATHYSIYKVTGNELLTGDVSDEATDGTTEAKRSKTLGTTDKLTKK